MARIMLAIGIHNSEITFHFQISHYTFHCNMHCALAIAWICMFGACRFSLFSCGSSLRT